MCWIIACIRDDSNGTMTCMSTAHLGLGTLALGACNCLTTAAHHTTTLCAKKSTVQTRV